MLADTPIYRTGFSTGDNIRIFLKDNCFVHLYETFEGNIHKRLESDTNKLIRVLYIKKGEWEIIYTEDDIYYILEIYEDKRKD